MSTGSLYFFCGKMGAGKTTRAKHIAIEKKAILLCQDEWLKKLYPEQIKTLEDYVKYSNQMKPVIEDLVHSILIAGVDVVMDFPGNTETQRAWFKEIFTEAGADHYLVYVRASDEVCLAQIAKRRAESSQQSHTDTPEMFKKLSKYFIEPMPCEGFRVIE